LIEQDQWVRDPRPDGALAFADGRRHALETVRGDSDGELGAAESRGEEAEAVASEAEAAGGEHGGEAISSARHYPGRQK
jgi:hypothetical protein